MNRRRIFTEEHEMLRASFRRWLDDAVVPHYAEWEKQGSVPREIWAEAAKHGYLAVNVPEELGGTGTSDFRFNAAMDEEVYAAGVPGFAIGIQNDVCLPYILAYAQDSKRAEWVESLTTGDKIGQREVVCCSG